MIVIKMLIYFSSAVFLGSNCRSSKLLWSLNLGTSLHKVFGSIVTIIVVVKLFSRSGMRINSGHIILIRILKLLIINIHLSISHFAFTHPVPISIPHTSLLPLLLPNIRIENLLAFLLLHNDSIIFGRELF